MSAYPTTWEFELDARTTHMSLTETGPGRPPVMATPVTIATQLAQFPRAEQSDPGVEGLLRVCAELMETSVIHYEFAAVAIEKALQALELMLRIKVDRSSMAGMASLIRQLENRGAVDESRAAELRQFVRMRNRVVGHPQQEGAMPLVIVIGYLSFIYTAIADLGRPDDE
jgi:hypothetical protein